MTRLLPFATLVALLSACSPSGLKPVEENAYAYADNLFPTGSEEEIRLAEMLAYEHLYSDADRLLDGVAELWTSRVDIDTLSTAHVRIEQTVEGIPVFGGESIIHLQPDGSVNTLTDNWVRHIEIDLAPSYAADEAIDYAAVSSGGWAGVTNLPEAELMVLRHEGTDHLVYKVDIQKLDGTEHTSMPRVFVDAKTGEVVWQYDNLQTIDGHATTSYNGSISFPVTQSQGQYKLRGNGVGTYTFDNTEPWWSSINASHLQDITSSSTTFSGDTVGPDAHFGVDRTVEYFGQVHSRNGINGNGGPNLKDGMITAGVHYGSNYNNAFWNGKAMVFGDGDGSTFGPLTSLDIAAHEMTHGVTEFSAGLIYNGESGALNESMSDVFGVLVEAWVRGPSAAIWKMGEDCYTPWNGTNDALRYMNDPSADGSSRDHYSTRYTGSADNGGVHWNSGIGNLAFYLAAQGGQHPNPSKRTVVVDGIGIEKAGKIWYRGLTQYMTSTTNFAGARAALVHAAEDLYGAGSAEAAAVANAWAEVGVGSPIVGPTPTPDPDPTPTPDPEPTPDPGDGNATGLSAATGTMLPFTVTVPSGATELRVAIQGGTGDADLYVRFGSAPTTSAYDCRPYKGGNVEECVIANPQAGTWHIGVRAYQTFSGVDLSTSIIEGSGTPAPTPGGDDFLSETGLSGAQGTEAFYTVDVPAGATNLVFTITGGTGDADLYVRHGAAPTPTTWDCRPYKSGNEEVCTVAAPATGTWHVMLKAYAAYSGVTLTGTWE